MSEGTQFNSLSPVSSQSYDNDWSQPSPPYSYEDDEEEDDDDENDEATISIQSDEYTYHDFELKTPIKTEKSTSSFIYSSDFINDKDPFLTDVIKCEELSSTTEDCCFEDSVNCNHNHNNSNNNNINNNYQLIVHELLDDLTQSPNSYPSSYYDDEYYSASSTEFDIQLPFDSAAFGNNKRPYTMQDTTEYLGSEELFETPVKIRRINFNKIKIEKTIQNNSSSIKIERIGPMKTTTEMNNGKENSCKTNGLLDRRKTKHHKVLSETDLEICSEESRTFLHRSHPSSSLLTSSPSISISSQTDVPLLKPIPRKPSPYSVLPPIRPPNKLSYTRKYFPTKYSSTFRHQSPYRENETGICKFNQSTSNTPCLSSMTNKNSICSSTMSSCSSSGTADILSDITKIPPEPLRMGRKVNKRGQRFSLWQFLMYLLDYLEPQDGNNRTGIRWVNRINGIFHIVDSKQVASLWGKYKERKDKMTYDSLARSLRHYYKKKLMAKINNRRLVYQIAQECLIWSSDTFGKNVRD